MRGANLMGRDRMPGSIGEVQRPHSKPPIFIVALFGYVVKKNSSKYFYMFDKTFLFGKTNSAYGPIIWAQIPHYFNQTHELHHRDFSPSPNQTRPQTN